MENSYRRSQLVVPFGVGAIVDFADNTLMSAGLNFWPTEQEFFARDKQAIKENCIIYDQRLQKRLSFNKQKNKKPIEYFLQPSLKPNLKNNQAFEAPMPFVRFPRWYFCSKCRKMKKAKLTDRYPPKCCIGKMYPMTFLIACERGHISDFPWREWLHHGEPACNAKECDELYYQTTNTPGIGGVLVECKKSSCNAPKRRRSLASIYPKPFESLNACIGGNCPGERPWLGEVKRDNCIEKVDFLQRAASNVYFANTMSSILIPPYSEELYELMIRNELWEQINEYMHDAKEDEIDGKSIFNEEYIGKHLPRFFRQYDYEKDAIIATAKLVWAEKHSEVSEDDDNEILYKKKEFNAFLGTRPNIKNRKNFDIQKQDINLYSSLIREFIDDVVLVPNIREVTALVGFSRIKPLAQGEQSLEMSSHDTNWLPATEVRGEGIFLNFNQSKIISWAEKNTDVYQNCLNTWKLYLKNSIENQTPNFTRAEEISITHVFIHTFSHLFIRQLADYAGYDTSSIKERIFASEVKESKMSGLLIYTASGDTEGTLGGLVRQGNSINLEQIILGVLSSEICSNDPICMDTQFQGIQSLNGAACYSCTLLPETCCEHNNTLLDRRILFGNADEKGFFTDIISRYL